MSATQPQPGRTAKQGQTTQAGHQKPAAPPRSGWFDRLMRDVFVMAKRDNKWWILPLMLVLLVMAALLALVTLAGPLAPFIYPLL